MSRAARIGIGLAIVFFIGMFVERNLNAPDDNAFACGVKVVFHGDDPCIKSGTR